MYRWCKTRFECPAVKHDIILWLSKKRRWTWVMDRFHDYISKSTLSWLKFQEPRIDFPTTFSSLIEVKLVITSVGRHGCGNRKKMQIVRHFDWQCEAIVKRDLPITVSGSAPKAQTNWDPTGTWNFEKAHFELKYLDRKERDSAKLCRKSITSKKRNKEKTLR